ncbi:hypothetical protein NDU88_003669 [Pleurodeles waltl]|uniref:Uncharacterized protein n=1 Tax=Pleurodeles waltl TaxID=8319 RepID=A0AAV7UCQ9_PLEWA|nr:hypothetical protein NDU88_003669 [Pleurodeles waltl]
MGKQEPLLFFQAFGSNEEKEEDMAWRDNRKCFCEWWNTMKKEQSSSRNDDQLPVKISVRSRKENANAYNMTGKQTNCLKLQESKTLMEGFQHPRRATGRTRHLAVLQEGHGSLGATESLGIMAFAFGVHEESITEMLKDFQDISNGIGYLKTKEIKQHIDKPVQPVALEHCRIAFHQRLQVEKELNKLKATGIIEKVAGPTLLVWPIVVAHLC